MIQPQFHIGYASEESFDLSTPDGALSATTLFFQLRDHFSQVRGQAGSSSAVLNSSSIQQSPCLKWRLDSLECGSPNGVTNEDLRDLDIYWDIKNWVSPQGPSKQTACLLDYIFTRYVR